MRIFSAVKTLLSVIYTNGLPCIRCIFRKG